MINITRSGNNVIVTSDNPKAFNISNGELSVPMNSIYYVLDEESDFIQFNSIDEKGEILFNGVIGDIQVNGTLVTREDIQVQLDSVFNSASGGGSASAGVNSINGFQGDVNIKSINGESLIGSGDITIEGGSGVEAINIGETIEDWTQKTGIVSLYTLFYDGSYDVSIDGMSFYGLKPIDSSIVLENAGGTVNGNFRCGIKVNEDNFKTINGESIFGSGDITIEGGSSGVEYVGVGENPSDWDKFYGGVKLYTSWIDLDDDSLQETLDVRVGGLLQDGTDAGTLWYGFTSTDNSILLSSYSSRLNLKVNEWIGTQAEYDALGTYDSNCTYYITE